LDIYLYIIETKRCARGNDVAFNHVVSVQQPTAASENRVLCFQEYSLILPKQANLSTVYLNTCVVPQPWLSVCVIMNSVVASQQDVVPWTF